MVLGVPDHTLAVAHQVPHHTRKPSSAVRRKMPWPRNFYSTVIRPGYRQETVDRQPRHLRCPTLVRLDGQTPRAAHEICYLDPGVIYVSLQVGDDHASVTFKFLTTCNIDSHLRVDFTGLQTERHGHLCEH
jgi:hypothetical protein